MEQVAQRFPRCGFGSIFFDEVMNVRDAVGRNKTLEFFLGRQPLFPCASEQDARLARRDGCSPLSVEIRVLTGFMHVVHHIDAIMNSPANVRLYRVFCLGKLWGTKTLFGGRCES